jgi:hypothetical protein
MGTAKKTPRYATDAPHAMIVRPSYLCPSICSAGIGPMRPAAMVMDPAAEATVWQMFASACVNGTLGLSALKSPMLTAAARMLRRTRGGEEEEEGARKGREGASEGGGNDGRRDEIRRRVERGSNRATRFRPPRGIDRSIDRSRRAFRPAPIPP